eukprot:g76169.t1
MHPRWLSRYSATASSSFRTCCVASRCNFHTTAKTSQANPDTTTKPPLFFPESHYELWKARHKPLTDSVNPDAIAQPIRGRIVSISSSMLAVQLDDGQPLPAVRDVLQCLGPADPENHHYKKNKLALGTDQTVTDQPLLMEVHSQLEQQTVACLALTSTDGFRCGDLVRAHPTPLQVAVGDGLLGRAVTALGRPVDGKPPPNSLLQRRPLHSVAPDAPNTPSEDEVEEELEVLNTGIKIIDFLAPLQKGGVNGLFYPTGFAGKDMWLVLAREARRKIVHRDGDKLRGRVIWALPGLEAVDSYLATLAEPDLLDSILTGSDSVLVCADRATPAMLQNMSVLSAAAMAEHWRDELKQDVLFLMPDLLGYVQNCTAVSTALRRLPCMGGYSPSLSQDLSALQERLFSRPGAKLTTLQLCTIPRNGDMTDPFVAAAIPYFDTVLVFDPLRKDMRGLWPALDPLESVSHVLNRATVGERHYELVVEVKKILERTKALMDIVMILGVEELPEEDQVQVGRAQKIEQFLSQPEYDQSKPYELGATLDGIQAIVEGHMDEVPAEAFFQVHTVQEAAAFAQVGAGGSKSVRRRGSTSRVPTMRVAGPDSWPTQRDRPAQSPDTPQPGDTFPAYRRTPGQPNIERVLVREDALVRGFKPSPLQKS